MPLKIEKSRLIGWAVVVRRYHYHLKTLKPVLELHALLLPGARGLPDFVKRPGFRPSERFRYLYQPQVLDRLEETIGDERQFLAMTRNIGNFMAHFDEVDQLAGAVARVMESYGMDSSAVYRLAQCWDVRSMEECLVAARTLSTRISVARGGEGK